MNKHQFNKVLSISALRQAQIMNDANNELIPSDEFNYKMKQLFQKPPKYANRKRIIKLAASIALFIGILSVTYYANATHINFFQVFQKSFSITSIDKQSWDTDFNAEILSNVSNLYLPTWMPKGFVADHADKVKTGNGLIRYSSVNDKRQFLIVSQKITDVKALDDSNVSGLKKIVIDNQVYYFGEKKLSESIQNNLVFLYEDRYFLFTSTLGESDLIKIAQSLKIKK